MSTRRRLPAAERRAMLEDAALALFAAQGYHGTGIDEIARAANVTPPVLYDHFASKSALHIRLLERTSAELLAMWRGALPLGGAAPLAREVLTTAFDAWARYVEDNPFAARMFFRETTRDPVIAAAHAQIMQDATGVLTAMLLALPAGAVLADPLRATMATQIIRGGLTELAIWWADHRDVSRDLVVEVAAATLWTGLEQLSAGA